MEIEKPFKCSVCGANFTNEDHLQVHKRKHEMSLTLGKTSQSTALESFTDETPTPTRFFQNCEEVGLFQDLQSVNPFDEQFSKATSSTASVSGSTNISNGGGGDHHHGPFDFSLGISSTSASASTSSSLSSASSASNVNNIGGNGSCKRRYSDQDTLNTPQVFGYIVNATSTTTNTCSTSSVLTPMPPASSTALDVLANSVNYKDSANSSVDGEGNSGVTAVLEDQDLKPLKVVSTSTSVLARNGSSNAIINRNKTKLKLNLSPNVTPISFTARGPVLSAVTGQSKPKQCSGRLRHEKKAEKLERNRAAAVRSRERRKQWVSSLETKCLTYESMISQLKAQVAKQNNEIQLLKNELTFKHGNCDVTKGTAPPVTVQHQQIQLVVHQQALQLQQPNILRTPASLPVVVATVASNCSTSEIQTVSNESQRIITVPTKARRGRPRKGEERRVNIVSVPALASPGIPLKIQLVPLNRSHPTNNDKTTYTHAVGL